MKINEALYQLKQNIKMHEIDGTTSNQNEREKVLLDYITNLQEENKRYKRIFEGKERFSKIMPDDTDFIILSKADYDRQQEDIELGLIDYKSRNEKAIEYIKENSLYYADDNYGDLCGDTNTLLKILQGEDNISENLYRYTPEKGFRLVGDDNE